MQAFTLAELKVRIGPECDTTRPRTFLPRAPPLCYVPNFSTSKVSATTKSLSIKSTEKEHLGGVHESRIEKDIFSFFKIV